MSKTYQVDYTAVYWVEANSEEEAIEKAREQFDALDGEWDAMIDPWDSNNFNTTNKEE